LQGGQFVVSFKEDRQMAKRAPNQGPDAGRVTLETLDAEDRREFNAVKRPITNLSSSFGVVREKLKEIAPRVFGLFNRIKGKHPNFSFVEFARMFAPDMPTHAADRDGATGYRNHRVYYTLVYMNRSLTQRPRGRQGVRDTAVDSLARTIATLLQVIEPKTVWTAIQKEFGYDERIMGRLQKRVEKTKPIFAVKARGVQVGNVIHMDREQAEQPQAGTAADREMTQPGRRVRRGGEADRQSAVA
jgi:hypothetical protein